ncbi:hypothetical protein HDU86_002882 [Geranomyces michiganensis]|nr:hypothetical protein HDU86_002882 [Geranomyces michiganensis]
MLEQFEAGGREALLAEYDTCKHVHNTKIAARPAALAGTRLAGEDVCAAAQRLKRVRTEEPDVDDEEPVTPTKQPAKRRRGAVNSTATAEAAEDQANKASQASCSLSGRSAATDEAGELHDPVSTPQEAADDLKMTAAAAEKTFWTDYLATVAAITATGCPIQRQKGRHLARLSEFHVADAALANIRITYDGMSYLEKHKSLVPAVSENVLQRLKESAPLTWATAALVELKRDKKIIMTTKPWWTFWGPAAAALPNDLVYSAIIGCHVDQTVLRSKAAEADTKQTAVRLIQSAVAFLAPAMTASAEQWHYVSDSCKGSGRSDLVVSVAGGAFGPCATLLVAEFAAAAEGSSGVHKDYLVAAAEAVVDSHAIISGLPLDAIENAKVHIFLVAERVVKTFVLMPTYRQGGIFWSRAVGPSFDLSTANGGSHALFSALAMSEYLREVVFPDGALLSRLLETWSTNLEVVRLLPNLPGTLPDVRGNIAITPARSRLPY